MVARVSGSKGGPSDSLSCLARYKTVATRASTGGCPPICPTTSSHLTGEEHFRGCSVVIRTTIEVRRGSVVSDNGDSEACRKREKLATSMVTVRSIG